MKYNSNKSLEDGQNYVYPIHKVVNHKVLDNNFEVSFSDTLNSAKLENLVIDKVKAHIA